MRTQLLALLTVILVFLAQVFAFPSPSASPSQSPSPSPLPTEVPARLVRGGLDVSVYPTYFAPARSPTEERMWINVTNPTGSNLTIGLYYLDGVMWYLIGEIGNVSAGATGEFEIFAKLAYTGESTTRGRYAVISEQLLSAEFEVLEDWTGYEARLASWMKYAAVLIAPALALVLIAAMVAWARAAERAEKRGAYLGEYTMRTLFRIPIGRSLSETAVLVLAHPLLWAFVLAAVAGAMAIATSAKYELAAAVQIYALSAPLAFIAPSLLLIACWLADRWEREPARFVVGMFAWGMLAAAVAFVANSALTRGFAAAAPSPELVLFFSGLAIAPIIEELTKGGGVAIMSWHHELDDTTDGLLYGFAAGLGFAAVENWYYAALRVDPTIVGLEAWVYSIAYRSLFNTLAHGCFTAFVGALIGAMKARPRFAPYAALALAPGLLSAIILHIVFNAAALADIVMVGRLKIHIFNPILVLIVVAGFIVVWHFANEETKRRIRAQTEATAWPAEK